MRPQGGVARPPRVCSSYRRLSPHPQWGWASHCPLEEWGRCGGPRAQRGYVVRWLFQGHPETGRGGHAGHRRNGARSVVILKDACDRSLGGFPSSFPVLFVVVFFVEVRASGGGSKPRLSTLVAMPGELRAGTRTRCSQRIVLCPLSRAPKLVGPPRGRAGIEPVLRAAVRELRLHQNTTSSSC